MHINETSVIDRGTLRNSINALTLENIGSGQIRFTLKYVRDEVDVPVEDVYEYVFEGDMEAFVSFLVGRFKITRKTIGKGRNPRHTKKFFSTIRLKVPICPVEVQQAMIIAGFNPEVVQVVDIPGDTEKNVRVRAFDEVPILSDRVLGVCSVEKRRYELSGGKTNYYLDYGYGVSCGVHSVMCKGSDIRNNIRAVKKLNRIPPTVDRKLSRIIAAAYSVVNRFKLVVADKLPFTEVSYDDVKIFTAGYNTSSGITEHVIPADVTPREHSFKLSGVVYQTGAKTRGLKSEFDHQVAEYTVNFFKRLFNHHFRDEKWYPESTWTRYAVHAKPETISLHEVLKFKALREATFACREGNVEELERFQHELEEADRKVRLFWGDSMYSFILDIISAKPMTTTTVGSGICVGVSSTNGGLNYIFDTLSRDPTQVPDALDADNLEAFYSEHEVVRNAGHSVGDSDIRSFDMSQNHKVLDVIATLPIIMWGSTDNMTDDMLIQLSAERANSIVYKFATIALVQATVRVNGAVPSGNFLTSWIDSFCQMLYWRDFIESQIEKMPLEMRLIAIKADHVSLFIIMVYGDDLMGTMSNYFNQYINWDLYYEFIEVHYKQHVKWKSAGEKQLYSRVEYTTYNGVIVETKAELGLEFIKFYMADVYLDGVFLYRAPHRTTPNLFAKLCYNSTADLIGLLHLSSSLAWLSLGNLEFFQIASLFYKTLRVKMRLIGINPDRELEIYSQGVRSGIIPIRHLPHSVRMLLLSSDVSAFPSLSLLRERLESAAPFLPKVPSRFNEKKTDVRDPHPFYLMDYETMSHLVETVVRDRLTS